MSNQENKQAIDVSDIGIDILYRKNQINDLKRKVSNKEIRIELLQERNENQSTLLKFSLERNWFLNVRSDKLQRMIINWKTAAAILCMITLLALFAK